MARYIDADAFKRKLADKDIFFPALYENELNETPTADVEEVKHGYWKHTFELGQIGKYHYWNCSLCGVASNDDGIEKYCPYCGAKMDGVKLSEILTGLERGDMNDL